LARKTFYHVSYFTAKFLITLYNKQTGKDDDDFELTTQKFLSQISFAVGSTTAFSLCNGAFGVLIDTSKYAFIHIFYVILLELIIAPSFGTSLRKFVETKYLTRVEKGKTKMGGN